MLNNAPFSLHYRLMKLWLADGSFSVIWSLEVHFSIYSIFDISIDSAAAF